MRFEIANNKIQYFIDVDDESYRILEYSILALTRQFAFIPPWPPGGSSRVLLHVVSK